LTLDIPDEGYSRNASWVLNYTSTWFITCWMIQKYILRLYPQLLVRWFMSYLCCLCLFVYCDVKHVLNIWVTWWVSYTKQDLLTLREYLDSTPAFGGVRVAHSNIFLCCVVFLCCLTSSCVLCVHCCQCLWIVHSWLPLTCIKILRI